MDVSESTKQNLYIKICISFFCFIWLYYTNHLNLLTSEIPPKMLGVFQTNCGEI